MQHRMAVNKRSLGSASQGKSLYAFLHDLLSILGESPVTFHLAFPEPQVSNQETASVFPVDVAPQQVRKMTEVLAQAEELQKEVEAAGNPDLVEKLHQIHTEISVRIAQELPAMVVLALIAEYCQKEVKALTQREQQRLQHMRRGVNNAVSCCLIGAVFLACVSIPFIIQNQNPLLFLLLLMPGLCLELAGVYCLRINAARRRQRNEILQRQTSLRRWSMIPLMLAEITNQTKKQAMLQAFLLSLLTYQ